MLYRFHIDISGTIYYNQFRNINIKQIAHNNHQRKAVTYGYSTKSARTKPANLSEPA